MPDGSNTVLYEFIRMPDSTGFGDYTESGIVIPAKFGDDAFVVIEKWESPEALNAHAASPHMAAYAAKTREMIASRVIHVLAPG